VSTAATVSQEAADLEVPLSSPVITAGSDDPKCVN
jgi:hypothetical protein